MTNKEAIEKLERHKMMNCHGCVHPSMVGWCEKHCQLPEAFDMAINALKAQEVSNNSLELDDISGGLISRLAVIDTVRKIVFGFLPDKDGAMNDTEKTILSVGKAICSGVRELRCAIGVLKPISYIECSNALSYTECADALLMMWMDEVLTDGEFDRLMDKLDIYYRGKNGSCDEPGGGVV